MPQPIETAPKDGTPILTDCGIAANWGGRYEDYWIPCSPDGKTYENDYDDPIVCPTLWEPLPSWMA